MGEAVIQLFERFKAPDVRPESLRPPRWCHTELVGRLAEISGISALSATMGVVLDAQRLGEPVAWVSAGGSLFYPPDVEESGIDLEALVVVRVAGGEAAARAADKLLRSGAFGLVVLDLGRAYTVPMALQARLVKLAQRHDAAVLALTDKAPQVASLSSLVSLRCSARREWVGGDRYRCAVQVLKDKRRGPVWGDHEELRAPAGIGAVDLTPRAPAAQDAAQGVGSPGSKPPPPGVTRLPGRR